MNGHAGFLRLLVGRFACGGERARGRPPPRRRTVRANPTVYFRPDGEEGDRKVRSFRLIAAQRGEFLAYPTGTSGWYLNERRIVMSKIPDQRLGRRCRPDGGVAPDLRRPRRDAAQARSQSRAAEPLAAAPGAADVLVVVNLANIRQTQELFDRATSSVALRLSSTTRASATGGIDIIPPRGIINVVQTASEADTPQPKNEPINLCPRGRVSVPAVVRHLTGARARALVDVGLRGDSAAVRVCCGNKGGASHG